MKGLPVVTAEEIRRLEERAYAIGESAERYMERAGVGVAQVAEKALISPSARIISLLVGKGNKGGDALAAGTLLLQKGFQVRAYLLEPLQECSPLCQEMAKRFQKAGGALQPFRSDFPSPGFLIDGLVGSGFKGKAEGILKEVIDAANRSGYPILAVDIPSGLNGSTGAVETVAIQAMYTVTMGLPKIGFFIGKGWDQIGQLTTIDFGLPVEILKEVRPEAYLFDDAEGWKLLPKIQRSRHKYQRGYLLALAGSPGMPGAALLACYGAMRAGAGIVRLFHPPGMEGELAPYELIREEWNNERLLEECKRARAVLIGPGLGRTEAVFEKLKELFSKLVLPTVLDADALFYLAKNPHAQLPKKCILTPHHEEMHRIIKELPTLQNCQAYVEKHQVTLVLKGAPTFIYHPGEKPLIVARGDPGMATAGAGDVLTGIIGALLAQGLEPYPAAALGVFLHDLAGELAASKKTPYAVIASDIVEALPAVFQLFLKKSSS